jgi:hypothetical protein
MPGGPYELLLSTIFSHVARKKEADALDKQTTDEMIYT